MKFYDLKSFYIVTDIKEHQENKDKLLSLIDKMGDANTNYCFKSDWHLPKETKREYLDFFYKMITPYMTEMAKKLKQNVWEIDNAWYQVYQKHDTHPWHTHQNQNYANVYYINLPDNSIKTELYDVVEDKIMDEIEVREGQLLTFPANILHRSPINTSNEFKTIISFNSNFYEANF